MAQSPAFFRYGRESGLLCEEIYEEKLDHLGFIWIATDRGVFRFDGYAFQQFTTAQGLTDNTVFRLQEDHRGRMWVMPFNGELCYIENDKVTEYQYNDTIEKYVPGVRIIRSIEIADNGALRVAFLTRGEIEISANGNLSLIAHADSTGRTMLWVDLTDQSNLMLGSDYGKGSERKYMLRYHSAAVTFSMSFDGVASWPYFTAVIRSDGDVVIAARSQIICIDPQGKSTATEIPGNVLCMTEDSKGCLWIGTDGNGVYKYASGTTPDQKQFEQFYPEESITSVLEDAEGGFWVATHHNGLLYVPYVDVKAWNFFQDDECNGLLPGKDGQMFVLWRDHGLTSISQNQARIYPAASDIGSFKVLCWNEQMRSVLVGSPAGVFEVDTATGTYHPFFGVATNSMAIAGGKTYFGSSWSLVHIGENNTKVIVGDPKIRHRPDVLFTDSKGILWVGALDGLYRVQDSALISLGEQNELFTRRIAAMCELQDSTLVIATQSNGIAFMRNGKTRTLSQADHFPCDHIYGVTAGKNNSLWCTTMDGLYEITVTADSLSFHHLRALNPILLYVGKPCYSASEDRLWLCDGNRVVAVQPELITGSGNEPPVFMRSVRAGDSLFLKPDSVTLNYSGNSMRIQFCGLVYRLQGHVHYRYRLRGSSDDWQFTDQNTVEFASLEPGDYTFEVQAENENGIWSSHSALCSLIILPPFYATLWFRSLAILLIAVAFYMIIAWRFRIVRRSDRLREQALIFRQQALASQINPHFLFNALNTIQSLVLKEEKTRALEMFNSFATLLRKSLEHSVELYISLEEELRMLELYFEIEDMRFEGTLEYNVILGADVDPELIHVPAMLVQPMVENAVLHGIRKREGGGKIEVRFYFRAEQLICEIDDNGIGRKASATVRRENKPAGTGITRDRLRVLGQMRRVEYSFEIIDKENTETGQAEGTMVRMMMPFSIGKNQTV